MNASYSRSARFASGTALLVLGAVALVVAHAGLARSGGPVSDVSDLAWVLSVSGSLLVALAVVLFAGPPWQKERRAAVCAAMWAHGFLGVAGVLLAGRLEGIVAASVYSAAGFELVVAVLCARALHRRRLGTSLRRAVHDEAVVERLGA